MPNNPEAYTGWTRIPGGAWQRHCTGRSQDACANILAGMLEEEVMRGDAPPRDLEYCILPRGQHPDDLPPAPWEGPPGDVCSPERMDAMASHFASQLPRRLAAKFDRLNQMVLRWLAAATEAIRDAEERAAGWEASCLAAMRALSARVGHGTDGRGQDRDEVGGAEQLRALRAALGRPQQRRGKGGRP